jgi:hypothetical protein
MGYRLYRTGWADGYALWIWKESVVGFLKYYSRIFLESLRENTANFNEGSQPPGRESNPEPLNMKQEW